MLGGFPYSATLISCWSSTALNNILLIYEKKLDSSKNMQIHHLE